MRAFLVALGMFTIIPVGRTTQVDRNLAGRVLVALPWVGLIAGALAGAALWLTALTGAALLPAVLGILVLAALTGALHLDGLADTADGLGSRKPAPEALEIMRRSDIGPMGVVTLLFALLLQVGALASLPGVVAAAALAVAAMTGRAAVVHAARGPGARSGGFGALFTGATSAVAAWAGTVLAVLVAGEIGLVVGGWPTALSFAAAVVLASVCGWLWRRHLTARLGGMTGDTFGSVIEVTQTVFLVTVALALV